MDEKGFKESVPLGQEAIIGVNTAEAGRGAINCHIKQPNGAEADLEIEDNNDGTVSIFYTPRIPGTYTIEIKFGGLPIQQFPLLQKVLFVSLFRIFATPLSPFLAYFSYLMTAPLAIYFSHLILS